MPKRNPINPVETENAIYEFLFSHHGVSHKVSIEGIDALVLETADLTRPDRIHGPWVNQMYNHREDHRLMKQVRQFGIPAYTVDIAPPDELEWGWTEWERELEQVWKELRRRGDVIIYDEEIAQRFYERCEPIVVWRDAICAHKMENTLAPYLAEKLGRKPFLTVAYGAAHLGIVNCLKDKERRNLILRQMYEQDLGGIRPDELYTVLEALPQGDPEAYPWIEDWILKSIPTEQPFRLD